MDTSDIEILKLEFRPPGKIKRIPFAFKQDKPGRVLCEVFYDGSYVGIIWTFVDRKVKDSHVGWYELRVDAKHYSQFTRVVTAKSLTECKRLMSRQFRRQLQSALNLLTV